MNKSICVFIFLMVFTFFLSSQEIIENPDKPINPIAGRILKVEEVFRITDESGEFYFKRPSRVQIADNGFIFLSDENQFLKFSQEGKFLKNLFKKGQGPGEIQSNFLYTLQGENIYIYDRMNSKILHMDFEGKLIEESRLTDSYLEFIGLWDNNFILSKSFWPAADERTGKIFDIPVKILFISKEEKVIKECPGLPMKTFISSNMAVSMGRSITIMSADGRTCLISDPDEYMISVLDLEKLEFIKKFKRNYPRVRRPKREQPSQLPVKIPERKYFNDIVYLYTFKGNLWVRTSTNDEKKGTLYDVFDSTGQYIDCFWLNAGESLQTTHENFLFVREQDEDGNMSIVKYRVLE